MAGHGFIPEWVKPPTGGWYHTPKNATANGMIALAGYFIVIYALYRQGENNAYNPRKAYSIDTVQRWNAAAAKKED